MTAQASASWSGNDDGLFLLMKRDLYYRPNAQGYTGIKDHAGRYTKAEADDHADDASGVTSIQANEAPDFSPACFDDLARAHLAEKLDEAARELATLRAQSQVREEAQPWEGIAPDYRFGRTIRPDDVDHLEAGSLFRFYSADPWFDDTGDMPRVGQIVRFTGKVERDRFPALPPHLEVADLNGRVYPGQGWQCRLFQFVAHPDTTPPSQPLAADVEKLRDALKHYACSCEPGHCAMSCDDTDVPVDEQMCGRRVAQALTALQPGPA